MDGLLLIDKPVGWTSHDVVAKVRSTYKKQLGKKIKVGHAGTLDPLASGLLILLVGNECKKQDAYMKKEKTYQATIKLGENSSTDDKEGEIIKISDKKPSNGEIERALKDFIGEINQKPPIFSALKVGGQRAYNLARQGKIKEMKARKVNIYRISDLKYKYPLLSFEVSVSSGTYIRSLARDIGEKLATGAHLISLRRTKIGEYSVENAQKVSSESKDFIMFGALE